MRLIRDHRIRATRLGRALFFRQVSTNGAVWMVTTMIGVLGASTRELMGRMGHSNLHAALVHQHRTADRDRAIAEGMDALAEAQLGTHWARIGHDDEGDVLGHGSGLA